MIPRIIYKIWIGNNPQPEVFDKYIDSWKNAQCNVQNMHNADVEICLHETQSEFLRYCIENNKYALINHYLRYWLLRKNGGVYMDLDVQVIKPFPYFPDSLQIGMESERWINNCFMAAPAGHVFFKDCLDFMDSIDINMPEIELETGPRLVTNMIQKHTIWKPHLMKEKQIYEYKDSFVTVYPERYFSPHRWYETFNEKEITPETITVHHYCHSWKP